VAGFSYTSGGVQTCSIGRVEHGDPNFAHGRAPRLIMGNEDKGDTDLALNAF